MKKLRKNLPVLMPKSSIEPAPHLLVLGPTDHFWSCMAGEVPQAFDLDSRSMRSSLDFEIDVQDDLSQINQWSAIVGVAFNGTRTRT